MNPRKCTVEQQEMDAAAASDYLEQKISDMESTMADMKEQLKIAMEQSVAVMTQAKKRLQNFEGMLLPLLQNLRNMRRRNCVIVGEPDDAVRGRARYIDAITAETLDTLQEIMQEQHASLLLSTTLMISYKLQEKKAEPEEGAAAAAKDAEAGEEGAGDTKE